MQKIDRKIYRKRKKLYKLTATLLALLMIGDAFTCCAKKDDTVEKDDNTKVEAPSDNKKDDEKTDDKADDKTDDKSDENMDNATVPDDKKEPDTSDKPAVMPDEKPTVKPEQPVQKPEQKPEQQPDQKPEDNTAESALAGKSLSEIIDMIYEKNPVEDLSLVTDAIDAEDADSLEYLTGITDGSLVSEASISAPMIGSIPYSLVVVRVKDKKDTATVAQQMKDNIDLRRWICVEADSLTVVGYDDVIMLFMINSEEYGDVASTDGMKEAFKSICGGSLDVDL